ncbi:MAG: hypothetical protein ACK5L9_04865 [Paracoccus sp. (in: a-proteobacteria)]
MKLPHFGGLKASRTEPSAFVNIRAKGAEEKSGVIDGKRVDDQPEGFGQRVLVVRRDDIAAEGRLAEA